MRWRWKLEEEVVVVRARDANKNNGEALTTHRQNLLFGHGQCGYS